MKVVLGFTHTEKGQIMGIVTAILYLLPLFTGVIADKIGYKLSLIIAYLLLISGYYVMGEVTILYYGIYSVSYGLQLVLQCLNLLLQLLLLKTQMNLILP